MVISNSVKTQDSTLFPLPNLYLQPPLLSHRPLLVLSQFKLCKLVGHLQRLLQALGVLARGLGRHVLAASFTVQQGAQLLNPLAGLQTSVGHILKRGRVIRVQSVSDVALSGCQAAHCTA